MKTQNEKQNSLENKRMMFFQVGLAVVLAVLLAAFEWKTPEKDLLRFVDNDNWLLLEELVPITVHKMEKPVPPVRKNETILHIVENDQEDDQVDIDAEDHKDVFNIDTVFYVPEPDPEPESEMIFSVVEEMPEFIGGLPALLNYLSKNVNFPRAARNAGISGKVYVGFVVFKDGTVGNVTLERGIGGGCDEEAIRAVKAMPPWKPGRQRGVAVNVSYVIPISFRLIK